MSVDAIAHKSALEPTGINRGRSILRPIGDVLPDELALHEVAWISKALELDFPGRDAIVEQLSCAKASRITDDASDDVRFDVIGGPPRIESSDFFVLGLKAFQDRKPYVSSELLAKEGKLDSFYIYIPDNSHLDLDEVSLDDVEHDIPYYCEEAKAWIETTFQDGDVDGPEGLERMLLAQAKNASEAVHKSLEDVAGALGGSLRDGLGPLCVSVRVPLGAEEDDLYEAIAQCSLVGRFFIAYPMRNGTESPFPGYGEQLAQIQSYPNGRLLGLLGDKLYELGYKPLTASMVRGTMVQLAEGQQGTTKATRRLRLGLSGNRIEKRLLDCYFSGFGLAG